MPWGHMWGCGREGRERSDLGSGRMLWEEGTEHTRNCQEATVTGAQRGWRGRPWVEISAFVLNSEKTIRRGPTRSDFFLTKVTQLHRTDNTGME